ncbi:MAG TPA: hypothetical protein VFM01_05160, partial [Nakamurella sp.]|nr:hypothetical protein [Nakamurella sp.]
MHYDRQPEPVAGDQVPAGHPLLSRRGLFKLSLAGGALIVGPGLLAACGAGGTENGGGAGGSGTPAGGTSTAGGSTSASQPAGQTSGGGAGGGGGEITVGAVGDISDFDPYKIL